LPEHQPSFPAGSQTADRSVDLLVIGSWLAVLVVTFALLRPSAPPKAPLPAPVPIVATAAAPDFYPWVRPGQAATTRAGVLPWQAPPKPRTGGFLTRLANPQQDPVFNASNYGNANSFYGGDWLPENIAPRGGGAFLEVKREQHGGLPYTAAEMQSGGKYHYGRYEAVLQPARGSGVVTAFFTYTGPWFGDPHDEIDIEFLGADTTKIHFNYFRNGKSIKPASFDLPFDASAAPHLYAFEWRPEGVTWFVDGVPYYATPVGDPSLPVSAGKVMFSAWTGKPSMEGWHGKALFRDGTGAQFNCVSFTPLGHDAPSCGTTYRSGGSGAASSAN
jgi:endo-1,3-1,4-beta-glycanase ExoK